MTDESTNNSDPRSSVKITPDGVRPVDSAAPNPDSASFPQASFDGGSSPWTIDAGSSAADAAAPSPSVGEASAASKSSGDAKFLGMAVSAARAMAKFAVTGFRRVSPEVQAVRFASCQRCDQLDATRCRLCGCFADKKAWLPYEDCPLGRWPK